MGSLSLRFRCVSTTGSGNQANMRVCIYIHIGIIGILRNGRSAGVSKYCLWFAHLPPLVRLTLKFHTHPHPRYSNSTRGRGSPAVPATHLMIQSATLTWTVSPAAAVISLGTATQPPCIIASRLALRKCGPTAHRRADGRGCGRGRLWPSDPRNGLSNT